jgi:hypothetical protein
LGLVPEFFIMLGIAIFIGTSLLSAILDEDLPWFLQYLFQGGATAGLGLLLSSQGTINIGTLAPNSSDSLRFPIAIAYLSIAVTSMVGQNVYLMIARGKTALSSALMGIVTTPTIAVAAIFVSVYLTTNSELVLSAAIVVILTVAAVVMGLSLSPFVPDSYLRIFGLARGTSQTVPVSMPLGETAPSVLSRPMSREGDSEEASAEKRRSG